MILLFLLVGGVFQYRKNGSNLAVETSSDVVESKSEQTKAFDKGTQERSVNQVDGSKSEEGIVQAEAVGRANRTEFVRLQADHDQIIFERRIVDQARRAFSEISDEYSRGVSLVVSSDTAQEYVLGPSRVRRKAELEDYEALRSQYVKIYGSKKWNQLVVRHPQIHYLEFTFPFIHSAFESIEIKKSVVQTS